MIGMTVCSGIGAPEVAAPWIDWKYQSEIEPFPCAVLAHRFPDAINLGDMTKFEEWPDATVDVLCGGTPCQDYSVAGKRLGMAGDRGSLTLTFVEIAAQYRPNWLVWENVPGVLSSNDGRDFARFLGDLSGQTIQVPKGGWKNSGLIPGIAEAYGLAYRVLDAQYVRTRGFPWAVPQRRLRVFVVGYLGDYRRAAAVLLDRESMLGNPAPRREAGKRIAAAISARSQGGGWLGTDLDGWLVAIQERAVSENPENGPGGSGIRTDGAAYTLEARTRSQAIAFDTTQITSPDNYSNSQPGDPCHPLAAGAHPPAVATDWAVRRLTPRECERLQGFDDDFTLIPGWTGRSTKNDLDETARWIMNGDETVPWEEACELAHHPDGLRYKALGNSIAVNVLEWIFDRLRAVEEARGEKQEAD